MSILTQKSLAKNISFEGVGIHSGKKVKIDIKQARPNTGIVFKRVDLKRNNIIIPHYSNVKLYLIR